ncbi:rac GTPase-activating protein 1-like isoform X2 [Oratosquilla oratoria]|uniref:rac GTPase-activating protein 1-like isoform X2 n=1 Tax=Oratosquilla oratoria TaxID=337810 RepID=UPI003F759664
MAMTSLVADYDDLVRLFKVLSSGSEDKFLEFLQNCEDTWGKTICLEGEVQKLQAQLNKTRSEVTSLELKLRNAKHLFDVERNRRLVLEKEKSDLASQIGMVVDLLRQGDFNETKERLQMLSTNYGSENRRSLRDPSPGPLSTINEDADTLESILSVSDIDLTEDDIEISRTRSGRNFKRKSSPERTSTGMKRQAKSKSGENLEVITKVTVDHNTKDVKAHVNIIPTAPPLSSDENEPSWCAPAQTPVALRRPAPQPCDTPTITKTPQIFTPTGTSPIIRNYSSASKLNQRPHMFYSKTIYKPENCHPCGKRIKFGKVALKCRDCRATCHSECRESVPLPCVATANTPNTKGAMGYIADYTPLISPMVPALVVHCTNEIENRGLNEVGIYRVPGAEREVKELKERFLRGKGVPNLSQIDVHVICGTLKDFLRTLKEPLVTFTLWKVFVQAAEIPVCEDSLAAMYQAITDLPRPNRDTLAWLIVHLQKVSECPDCKMPVSNLAKVFGPTVVGYSCQEPDPSTMLCETRKQQMVMEKLLEITNDYWNPFLNPSVTSVLGTPELNTIIGSTSRRRRSILSKVPVSSGDSSKSRSLFRDSGTPYINYHH